MRRMSEENEGFSMIVPVMAISNLVLTQQIYSEETNGAHAHYREPVPLKCYANTFVKVDAQIVEGCQRAISYLKTGILTQSFSARK